MHNYTIGRVWGIPIRVNVSLLVFLPVLAWLIGSGQQIELYAGVIDGFAPGAVDVAALRRGNVPWLVGAAAAVGLFASVGVHELGHAWAAARYGIGTESITLWILGGLASLESMPKEWDREFWIAIAGPVTSLGLAVACYAAVVVLPGGLPVLTFVVGWLVVTNATLAAFNLLPAFPMDGGRILRALLARRRPYASATRIAARIGSLFAILFAIVGVVYFSPMLLLLALFIYGAANGESRMVALDTLLEGVTAGDVMRREFTTVPTDMPVGELLDRMMADRATVYPVRRHGDLVGSVSLEDVRRLRKRDVADPTVADAMREGVHRVTADSDAFDVLGLLNDGTAGVVLVEEAGEEVGLVSHAEFTTTLEIRRSGGGPVAPRASM